MNELWFVAKSLRRMHSFLIDLILPLSLPSTDFRDLWPELQSGIFRTGYLHHRPLDWMVIGHRLRRATDSTHKNSYFRPDPLSDTLGIKNLSKHASCSVTFWKMKAPPSPTHRLLVRNKSCEGNTGTLRGSLREVTGREVSFPQRKMTKGNLRRIWGQVSHAPPSTFVIFCGCIWGWDILKGWNMSVCTPEKWSCGTCETWWDLTDPKRPNLSYRWHGKSGPPPSPCMLCSE